MRATSRTRVCGVNSQAGYLFERERRTRCVNAALDEPGHKGIRGGDMNAVAVMDGIKRMRVSSPTDSPKNDVDSDMTDEEAATPRTIVPASPEAGKKRPLVLATPAAQAEFPWKTMRHDAYMASERPIEIPSDASCRAMVVFNPYQSMPLSTNPRVELVEDDKHTETDTSESKDEHFVRFEELPEDNDEPVEMDVD
ncbi:hypothetical protein PPTG_14655 [Phytophthora nicotianae INRA-310]|uniref:Uncharacterized protein n=1 Tax=Phytophthora nicotianae (strain INRA-310) TaxID=761204 RepID=W2PVB4_PHYN3|nr:hypothetical protein PPTG_14655 [Phytophthora nicotianae INRA-310]ETN04903.1 hypothetical protein PPTG_14655 [Phytophthora nicotianae INRA-310]